MNKWIEAARIGGQAANRTLAHTAVNHSNLTLKHPLPFFFLRPTRPFCYISWISFYFVEYVVHAILSSAYRVDCARTTGNMIKAFRRSAKIRETKSLARNIADLRKSPEERDQLLW